LESNWRLNVALTGQAFGTWELAARYSGISPWPVYLVKESNNTYSVFAVATVFPSFWVRLSGPFPILPGERFPFGQPVFPD